MIRALCTESMHKHVIVEVQQMRDEQALAMSNPEFTGVVHRAPIINVVKHKILCNKNFREVLIDRRYEGIIWFMRSLDFCDINKIILKNPNLQYHWEFQVDMLRAGFALVCQKTDDIGKYQLSAFADFFRIIYETSNVNRPIICNRLVDVYQDVYERCHVDSTQANITTALMKCQGGPEIQSMIKLRAFFTRFSRSCQTLTEFYQNGDRYDTHLGEALANDTVFMNMLSSHIKRTALDYSLLPHLVLKTRLLLQHFPLAAIKMKQLIEAGRR
ncbi:hypothetical protein FO519_001069 [Halicephalobus sp. NKZ332]|nr:hypothetical protein FO519_001069 [Halicephalobus sp. NKZ332]